MSGRLRSCGRDSETPKPLSCGFGHFQKICKNHGTHFMPCARPCGRGTQAEIISCRTLPWFIFLHTTFQVLTEYVFLPEKYIFPQIEYLLKNWISYQYHLTLNKSHLLKYFISYAELNDIGMD